MNEDEGKVDLVCADDKLSKNEDVYLIDHAWTFKYREAEKYLRDNEKLLTRMLDITRHGAK